MGARVSRILRHGKGSPTKSVSMLRKKNRHDLAPVRVLAVQERLASGVP